MCSRLILRHSCAWGTVEDGEKSRSFRWPLESNLAVEVHGEHLMAILGDDLRVHARDEGGLYMANIKLSACPCGDGLHLAVGQVTLITYPTPSLLFQCPACSQIWIQGLEQEENPLTVIANVKSNTLSILHLLFTTFYWTVVGVSSFISRDWQAASLIWLLVISTIVPSK